MAHVYIANGIRTVVQSNGPTAQEYLHVFHFQAPTTPSAADCAAVNAIVANWINSQYHNMWPTAVTMRQIVSTGMNAPNAAQDTLFLTLSGARGGTMVPADVSLCLKAATHSSGRRRRGRAYGWPAVLTDLAGNDLFTGAYTSAMINVFNTLLASATTGGYPMCVASLVDAALYPISTFVAVDSVIDVQRRRLQGRGR